MATVLQILPWQLPERGAHRSAPSRATAERVSLRGGYLLDCYKKVGATGGKENWLRLEASTTSMTFVSL